jgi:hypothetical protein
MSKGLGWTQRECLRVIESYELNGKEPTTFNIAAAVYSVPRDRRGNRTITDAQHVATKRALAGLRRKGLVTGQQAIHVGRGGKRILALLQQDGLHAERCCFWTIRK